MVLFQTAAIHGLSTLYKRSMNPDRTPIPRMPRITDLSRFSTMGIRLSTCTMGTERISASQRTRRRVGRLALAHGAKARFGPFLDSGACIIATHWQRRLAALHFGTSSLVSRLGAPSFFLGGIGINSICRVAQSTAKVRGHKGQGLTAFSVRGRF